MKYPSIFAALAVLALAAPACEAGGYGRSSSVVVQQSVYQTPAQLAAPQYAPQQFAAPACGPYGCAQQSFAAPAFAPAYAPQAFAAPAYGQQQFFRQRTVVRGGYAAPAFAAPAFAPAYGAGCGASVGFNRGFGVNVGVRRGVFGRGVNVRAGFGY